MSDEVKCPKCNSRSFVRKGKSKDQQFQRLRCKSCGKNWSVECFKVNKQMTLPEILFGIIEHPDKKFSVNKIEITRNGQNKKHIKNIEFVTAKVDSYQKVVELASKLSTDIHPNTIKLDQHVPHSIKNQLSILFSPEVSHNLIQFMESLCKGQ